MTRDAFVEQFGEDQAVALETACEMHGEQGLVTLDNRGTDPFKTVLAVCIGFQCFELDGYRQYHGITPSYDEIKAWIKEHVDLGSHDGDVDFLAGLAGVYDEYVKAEQS